MIKMQHDLSDKSMISRLIVIGSIHYSEVLLFMVCVCVNDEGGKWLDPCVFHSGGVR